MKHILIIAALLATAGATELRAQSFVVVVNAANPVTEMSRDDVSKIFLKRQTRWADGQTIVAVDLDASSGVRDSFSRAVHGRPSAAIVAHWQQQIFSGREVPPAERRAESDALAFVRSNPNGITYVAAGTQLGAGLKTVQLR